MLPTGQKHHWTHHHEELRQNSSSPQPTTPEYSPEQQPQYYMQNSSRRTYTHQCNSRARVVVLHMQLPLITPCLSHILSNQEPSPKNKENILAMRNVSDWARHLYALLFGIRQEPLS